MKNIKIIFYKFKHKKTIHLLESCLKNQTRKTGEPLFYHSVRMFEHAVLIGLSEAEILQAILLHDILEDSELSHFDLEKLFSGEVCFLVDSLTCYNKEKRKLEKEEYFMKFSEALGRDWRILIIKLLDCIDNLETLSGLSLEKRERFLKEKRDIFLPIFQKGKYLVPGEYIEIYEKILSKFYILLEGEL